MRVLYVNHTSRVSGGELSLLTLLPALPSEVEPVVACPEGKLADMVRALGVEVTPIHGTDGSLRLHPTRTPRALAEMALAARQVRRAASSTSADLIHANSIRAGLVSVAAAAGGGPATVVHVRDCLPEGALSDLTLRAIGRADALIANSEHTRSTLTAARAPSHVVYNAVDLSRFDRVALSAAEARARLELPAEGPVLAVVAQITPWKGQDDAIRIAAALRRAHPGLTLLLVGSAKFDSAATRYDNAAYLDSLERQVGDLGLADAVRFLGERDDIPELLHAVDLLLVPSWEEPFGRAVIEAMAAGVPVVATDVGGPPEILGEGAEPLRRRPPTPLPRRMGQGDRPAAVRPGRARGDGRARPAGCARALRRRPARERDREGLRGGAGKRRRERLSREILTAAEVDLFPEALLEGAFREGPRMGGDPVGVEAPEVGPREAVGDRLDVAGLDQDPGLPVPDRLQRAAAGDGDHRPAGGLCLDRGDAELLDVGKDQRPGLGVELGELGVVDPAEEAG